MYNPTMKKNIAVIFGGKSAEHDVSIITAHVPIIQSLMTMDEFNVYPIYIAKNNNWYSNQKMNDIGYFKQDDFKETLKKEKKIQLSFGKKLEIIWPGIKPRKVNIDIVFPAMHGTFGEDGSLMGLLRLANIPFIGCDLFSSAIAMDKALTKQLLSSEDVLVVPYVWFTREDWRKNKESYKEEILKLNWPVFVKPVHLGSSIAITKVKDLKDLENAIDVALHYDDKVLVEESIEDLIEVTLPIMGNQDLKLGAVERPVNKTEFFDFTEKYLADNKKSQGVNRQYSEIPANIDKELIKEVESLGAKTYQLLGCSGISRIDFLIDKHTNKIYVNEINTLPGSLYHHNWKKVGISGIQLVKELINLAEEKFESNKDISYLFHSEILKKSGGGKKIEQ